MSITSTEELVRVAGAAVRVHASGSLDAHPILFLHGWPEDHSAWDDVVALAAAEYRCISIDLPGIGGSSLDVPNGDKAFLAGVVHTLIEQLGLHNPVLVGHDVGGMIAFAYLRQFADLRAAVVMDTVIPGVAPWHTVLANPYLWHFAFHSIPELPERLVRHETRSYLDYFFDVLCTDPTDIPDHKRAGYARSYGAPVSLTQGFEFYRALRHDAEQNASDAPPITTPVLYVRGEREGGLMADYESGFRAAGVTDLTTGLIPGVGHFTPEESPAHTWATIRDFLRLHG